MVKYKLKIHPYVIFIFIVTRIKIIINIIIKTIKINKIPRKTLKNKQKILIKKQLKNHKNYHYHCANSKIKKII